MGFGDQIKAFTDKAKAEMAVKVKEVEDNAKNNLHVILRDDVSQIKSITLDIETGKFYGVVAPENIIMKLRDAGLLQA